LGEVIQIFELYRHYTDKSFLKRLKMLLQFFNFSEKYSVSNRSIPKERKRNKKSAGGGNGTSVFFMEL
jgi:hypothetical protein